MYNCCCCYCCCVLDSDLWGWLVRKGTDPPLRLQATARSSSSSSGSSGGGGGRGAIMANHSGAPPFIPGAGSSSATGVRGSHSTLWIPPPVPGGPPVLVDTALMAHPALYGAPLVPNPYAAGGSLDAFGATAATGFDRPQWFEMRAVTDNPHGLHTLGGQVVVVPVTAVLADPVAELVWSGLDNVCCNILFIH